MMKILRNLKTNKSGASAAEYALMVAVMGGLVVAGVTALGGGFNVRDECTEVHRAETRPLRRPSRTKTNVVPGSPHSGSGTIYHRGGTGMFRGKTNGAPSCANPPKY